MSRSVKIFTGKFQDFTNGSIYPSITKRFEKIKDQNVDPTGLIYDEYQSSASNWEQAAYSYMNDRRNSFGRIVDLSKLKISPMYSDVDGFAMLLPIDNNVGRDYLTFNDPLWRTFLRELYKAYKAEDCTEGLESLRTMVISYNLYAPYTVEMSKANSTKIDDKWTPENRKLFSNKLIKYLSLNFVEAYSTLLKGGPDADPLLPNLNVTHSTGFNQRHYDYTRLNKADYQFVPNDLADQGTNLWAKYDLGPFKQECIDNGWVDQNLDKVLSVQFIKHCLQDPEFFCQNILSQNCSVHVTSYRTNNGDPALNSFDEFDDWSKGKRVQFYHKDRAMCRVSIDSGKLTYHYATYNCKSLNERLMEQAGLDDPLDTLKKRKVYPAPTATFIPPYVVLFRMLIHKFEDGPNGFPSNRECVLQNYDTYLSAIGDIPRCWVTFDRKNSEQFITDNYDLICSLFSECEPLQYLIKYLGLSVFASTVGPRAVYGGLPSGAAATTFLNSITGCFEMCMIINDITKSKFDFVEIVDKFFAAVGEGQPFISLGDWFFKINLGTDDQVLGVACKRFNSSGELISYCEDACSEAKSRMLGFDIGNNQTVFGMNFTETTVTVSSSLGLNKLMLIEKARLGDAIALKMYSRSLLLSQYVPIIQRVMTKLDLGTFSSFRSGADNYFQKMSLFTKNQLMSVTGKRFSGGAEIIDDLFNEYSPTEKMIVGSSLKILGDDFMSRKKKYKIEDVLRWAKKFKSFLNF